IRDGHVTGVQTCALPILLAATPAVDDLLADEQACIEERPSRDDQGTALQRAVAGAYTGDPPVLDDHRERLADDHLGPGLTQQLKIGRASCRERVEMSGAA